MYTRYRFRFLFFLVILSSSLWHTAGAGEHYLSLSIYDVDWTNKNGHIANGLTGDLVGISRGPGIKYQYRTQSGISLGVDYLQYSTKFQYDFAYAGPLRIDVNHIHANILYMPILLQSMRPYFGLGYGVTRFSASSFSVEGGSADIEVGIMYKIENMMLINFNVRRVRFEIEKRYGATQLQQSYFKSDANAVSLGITVIFN